MKKYIYIAIALLLPVLFISFTKGDFIETLKKYVDVYNKQLPQEKAYVQTDKTYYKPGENIWYKAFLMNATDNTASMVSDIMYVELTDPWGNVVTKRTHNFIGGTCNGDITLSQDIAGGLYKLTAYTSWMKNWGENAVFTKDITIQKVITPRLLLKLDFEKRAYGPGDKVIANLKVTDLDNNKTTGSKVKSTVRINGQTVAVIDNETSDGETVVMFSLPDDLNTADGILQIVVDDKGIQESITRSIPIVINKVFAEFFPEGGTLGNGVKSKVAFKSVNEFGKGADISGNIIDSKGDIVTNFESFHLGMGAFEFTPKAGEKYYAVITTPKGNDDKLELPAAENTYVLNLKEKNNDKLTWNIYSPANDNITLIGQTQGKIYYAKKLNLVKGHNNIETATGDFPIGAAVFTLFNGKNQEICQRMVYVNDFKGLHIEIDSKDSYMQGQNASVKIKTTDKDGKPVSASLGVAIIDEQLLTLADDKQDNILSYTMFSSELKEKVEEPNFYFDPEEKKAKDAIDYLMLTHTWKRFTWDELLNISTEHITEYPEKVNSVYGFVLDKNSNPVQTEVFLVETAGKRRIGQVKTTKEGHFVFHNVDNSGEVFVSAKLPNQVFLFSGKPAISGSVPLGTFEGIEIPKQKEGLANMDDGKSVVSIAEDFGESSELNDVVVVGYGVQKRASVTGSIYTVRSESLMETSVSSSLVGMVAGLTVSPGSPSQNVSQDIMIRGISTFSGRETLVVVNGVPISDPSASFVNPTEIESMQVLKSASATAIYGSRAANGVIVITTKQSRFRERIKYKKSNYAGVIVPRRNIYYSRRFYKNYNENNPSTVFWDGNLQTNEKGEATAYFYNNYQSSTFRITVEGYAHNKGLIGYQTKRFVTNKPLSVDAKTPLFAGVGDVIKIPVMLKNTTDEVLYTELKVNYYNTLTRLDSVNKVEVPAGEYKTVYLQFKANTDGKSHINILARSNRYSDNIYRDITVRQINFPYQYSFSGDDAGRSETVEIGRYVPGTLKAEAVSYTSMLDELFDGVESIFREPYGCFEQVSSSTFPNIFAMQLMEATGQNKPEVYKKAMKYLENGYRRLAAYEVKGTGGFEWYGGSPAHEVLSAYGLVEFYEMGKVYKGIDRGMMNRALDFILSRKDGKGGFHQNSGRYGFSGAPKDVNNAYIVYALSETGYIKHIDEEYKATLKEALGSDDIYRKALLANAAFNMGDKDSYNKLIAQFKELSVKTDFAKMPVKATIVYSYGETAQREAVAFWMLALLKNKENMDNALVDKCLQFINKGRRNGSFGNTQATSICLQALTKYAETIERKTSGGSFCVKVNSNERCESVSKSKVIIPIESNLKIGTNHIEVKYTGKEHFPYSINLSWQAETPASSKLCPLQLSAILAEKQIKVNETVRLSVKIENKENEGKPMSVAVIGIPGGLSLQPWQLKELQEKEIYDFYEIIDDNLVIYYRELGPEEVKTINLDLKAEVPGTYKGMASSAYVYYMNEHKHWVGGISVEVKE